MQQDRDAEGGEDGDEKIFLDDTEYDGAVKQPADEEKNGTGPYLVDVVGRKMDSVDGYAYSGAAVLLAAGAKGKRYILPHGTVMIHQPHGGVTGQAEDIRIQAEQIIKAKTQLNKILSAHTGQSIEQLHKDGERDKFFDAEEAKAYGLVDEILSHPPKES